MNPITNVAATCTRLSPLGSPSISPRTSPWQSPVMAYKFGKTLSVPASEPHRHGGRRGSHDKRELFAYPDKPVKKEETRKKKKNIRFEIHKHEKDKPDGGHVSNTTAKHEHGAQKKKKLKDVAKEMQTKESKTTKKQKNKKKKDCILM